MENYFKWCANCKNIPGIQNIDCYDIFPWWKRGNVIHFVQVIDPNSAQKLYKKVKLILTSHKRAKFSRGGRGGKMSHFLQIISQNLWSISRSTIALVDCGEGALQATAWSLHSHHSFETKHRKDLTSLKILHRSCRQYYIFQYFFLLTDLL